IEMVKQPPGMAAGDHVPRRERLIQGEFEAGCRFRTIESERRPNPLAAELAERGGGEMAQGHVAGRHRGHAPQPQQPAYLAAGLPLELDRETEQEMAAVEGIEGEAFEQEALVEVQGYAAVDERQVLPGKERRESRSLPDEDRFGLADQTLRRGEEKTVPAVGFGVNRAAGVIGPDRLVSIGEAGGELIDELTGREAGPGPKDLPEPRFVVGAIGSRRSK